MPPSSSVSSQGRREVQSVYLCWWRLPAMVCLSIRLVNLNRSIDQIGVCIGYLRCHVAKAMGMDKATATACTTQLNSQKNPRSLLISACSDLARISKLRRSSSCCWLSCFIHERFLIFHTSSSSQPASCGIHHTLALAAAGTTASACRS